MQSQGSRAFQEQPKHCTSHRQLKDMEEEPGKQLLIIGNRRVTLTEEEMILRKRAEEIIELVKNAENEISLSENVIAVDITVGAGETNSVRFLIRAADSLQKEYPTVHFRIVSGDMASVFGDLDRGLSTPDKLNIVATYNLLFNGSLMAEEGMGYAICFDKIINVSYESNLCFRPLKPKIEASMNIVRKKYQVVTKTAEKFLQKLQCKS